MKKIYLVEPKAPGFHVFSRFRLPRLGGVLLGTILRDIGYEVKVFVEDVRKIDFEELATADLVGISTITSTAPRGYGLAARLRERGVPAVIGGPHPTFLPDEALEHADYVIRGEGEETIVELVQKLEEGKDLSDIAGLSFKDEGEVVHNTKRRLCPDLDSLPAPDLSLIEGFQNERIMGWSNMPIVPSMSSRGCPFNCNFCSVTPMFGRKYRFRSADKVMEDLTRFKGSQVFFYDDNFAADKARTKELLRLMLEEDIIPGWSTQMRVDVARDDELLELMERTNCSAVYVGLESINPETLKSFEKGQTLADIEQCIEKLHKHKIWVHGMFVLGSDQDDINVIRDTAKFAKKLRIDSVQFAILTPLPGSKIFDKYRNERKIFTYDWNLYDSHHVVYKPERMLPIALQVETMRALSKFYSWGEVVKELFRGNRSGMMAKSYGNVLLKKWRKINKDFRFKLKNEMYDELNIQFGSILDRFKDLYDRKDVGESPVAP